MLEHAAAEPKARTDTRCKVTDVSIVGVSTWCEACMKQAVCYGWAHGMAVSVYEAICMGARLL